MIHRRFVRALSVVVALTSVPWPSSAAADEAPSADVDRARQHFVQGVKLFEETDYRAALIEFQRAYETAPNWSVLYNIAQCHYQLLDYAAAMRSFEKYLAEGGAAVPADRRAKVDKELVELRGRVGTIKVTTNVPGVEIFVDDISLGATPLAEPMPVSAGRRKIVAVKQGYVTLTKALDVAGGDRLDVPLALEETKKDEVPLRTTTSSARSSTFTYIGFGVAGAGLIVGSVFGLMAMSDKSEVDAECPTKKCAPASQPKLDALSRDATISTIGFGAAIVGLGLGVYSVLAGPRESTPTAGAAHVTPWIGVGSAGVMGSF